MHIRTVNPFWAATWAMPWPIRPKPTMPTCTPQPNAGFHHFSPDNWVPSTFITTNMLLVAGTKPAMPHTLRISGTMDAIERSARDTWRSVSDTLVTTAG